MTRVVSDLRDTNQVVRGTFPAYLDVTQTWLAQQTFPGAIFTGVTVAPTAAPLTNNTQIATTAYADQADAALASAVAVSLALKANIASPTLTGIPAAPTAAALNNSTQIATTAYADGAVSALSGTVTSALALKANINSPTLTGVPAAPTAAGGTNTTQIATTAFVASASFLPIANPTFTGSITGSSSNAGIELGNTGSANTPFVDFHSSGNNIDYDCRIISSGGTASPGQGTLTLTAASIALGGVPTAATAAAGTSTTQLATTAFVGTATNFLQAGTGAVTRTQQNKSRDDFNVKDFGAVGDGSTDDYTAIAAALAAATAAGGGKVQLTRGTFIISNTLLVADNVALVGEGSSMTTIKANNGTLQLFTLNGLYPQIRGFAVDMTGTPTAGNQVAIQGTGTFSFTVDDILIKNCWNGIVFQGTSNGARMSIGYVTNLKLWNFRNIGIYLQYVNDIFFQNTLVYQKDIGFNVGNYALYLTDNCEAINFDSGDFVGGAYSMVMTSASPGTHSQRPAYNAFNACYFDSAANGTLISAGVLNSFTNCWFSTGGLGGVSTAYGIDIVTCDSLLFTNCRFHTNAKHGAVVESGGLRVGFVNCTFEDNSVLAAAHAGHGLVIADSANGVEVIGGFARNGDLPSAQGYGIFIGSSVTNVSIVGVDLNGNFTGSLSSATQIGSTTCSVRDCKGFVAEARGQSTILNATSSLSVAHGLGGTPQTVLCTMLDTGGGAQAGGANIPRVLSVGSTNFTFDIGVVATAARPFSWLAIL